MEDVKEMLFKENQAIFSGAYNDEQYTVESVAKTVWDDIKDQKKNDFDVATESMRNLSDYDYPDAPNYDDFRKNISTNKYEDIDWDAYNDASSRYIKKKLNEFFNMRRLKLKKINNEEVTEGVFYNFEFSDNDGSYFSALEHSDLFANLKHLKISNH